MDFAEVLHLLHVTVLPLVPWEPPSLKAPKKNPKAQNAAGDFPRMGWVISRKGSCSGDAVLLPSFGAMQKSDKGGSPTDLRIKCWEKSRGFTSVLSFCGNQGR